MKVRRDPIHSCRDVDSEQTERHVTTEDESRSERIRNVKSEAVCTCVYVTEHLSQILIYQLPSSPGPVQYQVTASQSCVHPIAASSCPTVLPSGGSKISKRGCQPESVRELRQPIIWPKFATNCMKMKKIRPRGGVSIIKILHVDNLMYPNA